MNVRKRLEELERKLSQGEDVRVLETLCRATQGDLQARASLERVARTGKAESGLLGLVQVFLAGPAQKEVVL